MGVTIGSLLETCPEMVGSITSSKAGLKDAPASVATFRKTVSGKTGALTLKEALIQDHCISLPKDDLGRVYRHTTAMADEAWGYQK